MATQTRGPDQKQQTRTQSMEHNKEKGPLLASTMGGIISGNSDQRLRTQGAHSGQFRYLCPRTQIVTGTSLTSGDCWTYKWPRQRVRKCKVLKSTELIINDNEQIKREMETVCRNVYRILYFLTGQVRQTSMWLARSLWSRRTADKDSTQVLRDVSTWFVELRGVVCAAAVGCEGTAPCWLTLWLERWLYNVTKTIHLLYLQPVSKSPFTYITLYMSQLDLNSRV